MRQQGVSREEFTAFYVANKDKCLRAVVAGGARPDRAEDAVAEAFARAWARWRTVRDHPAPAAWVVRTAVNSDISSWRRRRREVMVDPPDRAGSTEQSSADLIAAIRGLPERQRQVVVLRYLLDLDTSSTAHELGIAEGTVKATLHQALGRLRVLLAASEEPLLKESER